jgi:hypothetical protein
MPPGLLADAGRGSICIENGSEQPAQITWYFNRYVTSE